jgi:hypothetical protein
MVMVMLRGDRHANGLIMDAVAPVMRSYIVSITR